MTYRFQKTLVVLLTLVLVGFSWLGQFGLTAEANVTLVSFDVVRGAAPTGLDVVWETATETDLVGFRVKRSATEDQQGATTIATVPQQGTATTGASYTYPDGNLTTGQTYYYWLYELTSNGEEVLITPNPEFETPGGLSSPTNTPTLTPTTVPTSATDDDTDDASQLSEATDQHADGTSGCEPITDTHDPSDRGNRNVHCSAAGDQYTHWQCAASTTDQHIGPGCAGSTDQHAGCFCSHSHCRRRRIHPRRGYTGSAGRCYGWYYAGRWCAACRSDTAGSAHANASP